jgi:cell division transport system ATP-binding protein
LLKFVNVSAVIELNQVNIYQSKKLILENVNLTLNETEFAYLIGKTGSGKSSLLKILYGELPLIEGNGSVAGFDLKNLKRRDVPMLRRKIGIVFQDFQLLMDRTVIQNMIFVLSATGWKDKTLIQKRALSVLQLVGVEQKANAMPHALSGGEQQRIAIARALLNQPELLLADEPTGNLDPETSEEIMHLLIAVAKEEKSAILMATHDLNMVKKFPAKVLRVGNGSVTEVNV